MQKLGPLALAGLCDTGVSSAHKQGACCGESPLRHWLYQSINDYEGAPELSTEVSRLLAAIGLPSFYSHNQLLSVSGA